MDSIGRYNKNGKKNIVLVCEGGAKEETGEEVNWFGRGMGVASL